MPPDHPPHRASVQKLFITGLLTLLPIWLTWVVIKFVFVLLSDISKPWVEPLSHRIAATFPQSLGWFNVACGCRTPSPWSPRCSSSSPSAR